MKNLKKIVHMSLLALGLMGAAKESKAQTISNHYFGQNAWMPDTIGNANACTEPPCILYGKLHQNWGKIQESGAQIIRFGGITPDKNMPTNAQYIRMIDSIRAKGMEPIMQVPFHDYRYTAGQAADIVHYLNDIKHKNIKYWIIGNEPNLGYGYNSASQIANYIRPFASAMKNVDPSIIIIGPEVAWYHASIINGLTTPGGPDDITGKDAAGHYYVDVISFHTYPFNGSQSRADMISKLTAAGSLQDNLVALNGRIANCNTYHNRSGAAALKTAITEANVCYKNDPSDNLNGNGVNSFIGGQFVAEMLGIGMKNGVDFINMWSAVEGNNTALNIGYIDPQTGKKKPAYYHFKMMADNFRGNVANATSNKNTVKTFASKNATGGSVMIMNEELTADYQYTVKLNTSTISSSNPLKVNVDAGLNKEYTDMIPAQSTVVLTFNAAGTITSKTEYSLTGHAVANLAPTVTQFVSTGIADNQPAAAEGNGKLDISVYPNPSIGKFTVELSKGYSTDHTFNIEMFNLLGQQVYSKKSNFTNGKEEVQVEAKSLAAGAYIVRVKEGENIAIKRVVLNK